MQDLAPLDYRDRWPPLEVTLEVRGVERFSLSDGTFSADVAVQLDWLDFQLKENVHFFQNHRLGKFEYAATVRMDPDAFFNPEIYIENQDLSGGSDYNTVPSAGMGTMQGSGCEKSFSTSLFTSSGGRASVAQGEGQSVDPPGWNWVGGSSSSRGGSSILGAAKNVQDAIPTIVDPGVKIPPALRGELEQAGSSKPSSFGTPLGRRQAEHRVGTRIGSSHEDPVWLTKWFRFRGQFNCLDADAVCFPLDIQKLPFRIRGKPLPHRDGVRRDLVLKDPVLRRIWRHAQRTLLVPALQWREDNSTHLHACVGRGRSSSSSSQNLGSSSAGGGISSSQLGTPLPFATSRSWRAGETLVSSSFSSSSRGFSTSGERTRGNASLTSNAAFQRAKSSDELLRVENFRGEKTPNAVTTGSSTGLSQALDEYARLSPAQKLLLDTPPHLWTVKQGLPDLVTNQRQTLTVIGENRVLGFGGVARGGGRGGTQAMAARAGGGASMAGAGAGIVGGQGQTYECVIVVMRNWRQYRFDYLIQIAQVISAAASFYVPFSEEMLAQRLSITLAILLTLTLFTKERPPVIEEIPYSTIHDEFQQFM